MADCSRRSFEDCSRCNGGSAGSTGLLCRQGRKLLELQVGDQAMVHREYLVTPEARNRPCDKLRPRWYGPFKVTERITTNAFRLDLPHQLKCHPVFNITALKKFHQNEFEGRYRYTPPPPPITDLGGFERYIVEKILAHKRTRRGTKFLVKWAGYPDATWEPEEFLKNEIGEDLEPLKEYKEAVGSCVKCIRISFELQSKVLW